MLTITIDARRPVVAFVMLVVGHACSAFLGQGPVHNLSDLVVATEGIAPKADHRFWSVGSGHSQA